MNSLVSIIIPTFNRAILLKETLESVLKQTYSNWECLVIDDGSDDATKEVITDFSIQNSRIRYYERPASKIKGPSSCRNFGIEKSTGELLIFLDSDDLFSPTCLADRVGFATLNPGFNFWIFKMELFKLTVGDSLEVFNTFPSEGENESQFYRDAFLQGEIPFCVTSPLWSTNALKQLHGFDENMRMLEDPDLHFRAYQLGFVSLTSLSAADCFYRKEVSNDRLLLQKSYEKIAAISNFYFLKKHFIVGNKFVKENYKRIFNRFVFYDKSFAFQLKMLQFGYIHKIITIRQVVLSYMILFYCTIGIDKIKGSGYTFLRTKFNNF